MAEPSESPAGTLQRLLPLLLTAAAVWHVYSVMVPPAGQPPPNSAGRDFASYYYALQAFLGGLDGYDPSVLGELATADATRTKVHPFFYPPTFLLSVLWSAGFALETAFRIQFWLNELLLVAGVGCLWQWLRSESQAVLPVAAMVPASLYAVAYGQELGQANLLVFCLVAAALWGMEKKPWLAGMALGAAAMFKMAPALLVGWWILHKRWEALGGVAVSVLGLSLASLPIVPFADQVRFYTEILPAFGSGDYNGLTIKISMMANHSLPNLFSQSFPGTDHELSSTAQRLSLFVNALVAAMLAALFATRTSDKLQLAAQGSAVLALTLLVPVFTYEHHLVFLIPGLMVGLVAVAEGRLRAPWGMLLGVAWAVVAYPLPWLRKLVRYLGDSSLVFVAVEAKFVAILVVLAAMATLGAVKRD